MRRACRICQRSRTFRGSAGNAVLEICDENVRGLAPLEQQPAESTERCSFDADDLLTVEDEFSFLAGAGAADGAVGPAL